MENKAKVSIIIACYNQASYLEKVLLSLQNQTFNEFEILIADDGSKNDVFEVVEKFTDKFLFPIQHIWHEDNGFRKTIIVNRAVQKSNGDYLIFIDGDCILHHKFIARHFIRRERNTILSGRRIMLDETISNKITSEQIQNLEVESPLFWWNNCLPKERKRGFYIAFIYKFLNAVSQDYWAFGSNYSLFKADFLKVNGYDEDIIGRGFEDINISQRFKLIGFKTKRLTYEALQYHLFHYSKPVPHLEEDKHIIANPTHFFAKNGIVKEQ